jgi:hypothetical protein
MAAIDNFDIVPTPPGWLATAPRADGTPGSEFSPVVMWAIGKAGTAQAGNMYPIITRTTFIDPAAVRGSGALVVLTTFTGIERG